jgi:putative aminopeptidase FrvX
VPSGVVSTPARYIHSPSAILNLDDVEKAVQLVVSTLENVPKYF